MPFNYDSENIGNDNQFLDESGTYNVAISSHKVSQTSTGKDMLTVDYQVLDGDHKGQTINYDNYVDGEKSKWRINRLINKTLGDKVPKGYQFKSLDQIGQVVTGKPLSIRVEWQVQEQGKHIGDYYLVVKNIDAKLPASMPDGKKRPGSENESTIAPKQTQANDLGRITNPFAKQTQTNDDMEISDDDLPF